MGVFKSKLGQKKKRADDELRACLVSLERGMVMHTGGADDTAWLWHPGNPDDDDGDNGNDDDGDEDKDDDDDDVGVEEGWWERIADLPHRLYAHACTYQPEVGSFNIITTTRRGGW